MSPFISTITRRTAPIVAAGAILAALALPSAATATPAATLAVSVVDGHLSIDSLSGTTPMHVQVIHTDADTIRVTDPGGTAQAGDRCLVVQDDDTVDCQAAGVERVQFEGSPLGDALTFEAGWLLPVLANGWGGDDSLAGADAGDTLRGGDGNDTLRGGAGQDSVFGESGNDRLFGGTGSDILRGGIGADRLFAKGDRSGYSDTVYGGPGKDRATLDKGVDTARQVERRSY